MKSDDVYLHHILDAIIQVETYVVGVNEAEFYRERMVQDAVVRQLEIIGEASRRLSDDFCAKHTKIPWRAIIGMRNRIAHDYINVDVKIVWEVVQHDLPNLKDYISNLLI